MNSVILFAAPSVLIAIGSLVYLWGNDSVKNDLASRWKFSAACFVLPGLLFLLLFFSLAIHMHKSLGQWPERIGSEGFPPSLITHGDIAVLYFSGLLLFVLFAWPILVGVFAGIPRAKPYLPLILGPGVSFWIFVPWMFLAPADFLNWWWD